MEAKFKKVDIKDLKAGDEILVGTSNNIRYYKLLRNPAISKTKTKPWWPVGYVHYKAIKVTTNINTIQRTRAWGNNQVHTWFEKEYVFGPDNHNTELYVNLNGKGFLKVIKD